MRWIDLQNGGVPKFGLGRTQAEATKILSDVRLSPGALTAERPYNLAMSTVVSRNPNIMHGAPCFEGTRVTVRSLFDHLEAGYSIERFLAEFPTVRRDQVIALLEQMKNDVEQAATAGSQ